MIGIYPNGTLTIDTISEDRAWARAIARGCLSSRLHGSDQRPRNQQPEWLRQGPIEFIGDRHPHCQYE